MESWATKVLSVSGKKSSGKISEKLTLQICLAHTFIYFTQQMHWCSGKTWSNNRKFCMNFVRKMGLSSMEAASSSKNRPANSNSIHDNREIMKNQLGEVFEELKQREHYLSNSDSLWRVLPTYISIFSHENSIWLKPMKIFECRSGIEWI